ncbi:MULTISPECIES: hypothetical protein [unclassified Mesorhizobium]|uniref:hypothetical protein n=1 Tax=unclassified Mesorhizobium TaxID=325217 RepID=UPI000FCC05A4|nr:MULTISPECIES: hypothetical protein [unclassified Mesorhizobium]RUV12405.1 hypothetical protein EOA91_28055 [Mesorhizobium sp. M1A.F.Ca.IN.022.04.1.1]RWG26252.1 MAG: hypothetical protein EOQ60_27820 [Mesorhizobium sp.]
MLYQNQFDPSGPQQTLQQTPQPSAIVRPAVAPNVSYGPVSSPWEGVARVANAMMVGRRAGQQAAVPASFSDAGVGRALGQIFGPSLNF